MALNLYPKSLDCFGANAPRNDTFKNRTVQSYIAENPLKGSLIIGTGGARKIRWASDLNTEKSGGARIIYYYHNQNIPIFLFTAFSKNQKTNITQSERNLLKTIISRIVDTYEEKNHE